MSVKTTRTLKIAAAAVAVAIAGAAIPGSVTPAEAKKLILVKKHIHHGHHFHRRHIGPVLFVAGATAYAASRSCYWMKVRALNTGSEYWWERYQECRGN